MHFGLTPAGARTGDPGILVSESHIRRGLMLDRKRGRQDAVRRLSRGVYVMHNEEARSSKIGIAFQPEIRRRNLQTGSVHELTLFGTIWVHPEDARTVERHARRRLEFSGYARRGEWFRECPPSIALNAVEYSANHVGKRRSLVPLSPVRVPSANAVCVSPPYLRSHFSSAPGLNELAAHFLETARKIMKPDGLLVIEHRRRAA